jgi:hypothetical protein
MRNEEEEKKKRQVIGLFGEMQLAMVLHERGWQVHRAYIDEGIDFVITKYWCTKCQRFSNQYIRYKKYKNKNTGKESTVKCVTNLCEHCKNDSLLVISKYLQVKTSEGELKKGKMEFSFHPKIRYNIDKDIFYVWIAVFLEEKDIIKAKQNATKIHYYIFNTKQVSLFDNVELDSYQITDNQKTALRIDEDGKVLNKGKIHSYDCFEIFHNNFNILDSIPDKFDDGNSSQ